MGKEGACAGSVIFVALSFAYGGDGTGLGDGKEGACACVIDVATSRFPTIMERADQASFFARSGMSEGGGCEAAVSQAMGQTDDPRCCTKKYPLFSLFSCRR